MLSEQKKDPKIAQMIAEIMLEEIQIRARKKQLDEKKRKLDHYKTVQFEKKITRNLAS